MPGTIIRPLAAPEAVYHSAQEWFEVAFALPERALTVFHGRFIGAILDLNADRSAVPDVVEG